MKSWLTVLLILVFMSCTFSTAYAGKKTKNKEEEVEIELEDDDTSKDIKKTEEENPPSTGADTKKPATDEDDDLKDLDDDDDKKSGGVTDAKKIKDVKLLDSRTYWADIKVVPRKLILKQNRIELIPYFGTTLNDNLIRHYLVGGEFFYHLSDALSVGAGGHAYLKQQTDRAYLTGLQQRALPTLNQYLFTATLNANYEAAYGKMAIHNNKILQWGIFLGGGLGVTSTEVIPRNAGHEPWTNFNITIQVSVGLRVFISKWLTVFFSVRNYMMQDKFENSNRDITNASAEDGEKTSSARFINNIVFQLGISVFFPMDFEYTTFK
jgi:outer membrane beta-barrel protein